MIAGHINNNQYLRKGVLLLVVFLLCTGCAYFKKTKKDSVFKPEESLREANELIDKGYHEEAREVLEDIRARDASQQYAILARIRIADSYFEDGAYDEASIEYDDFLHIHQYHKYASYAQYRLAMCYFKRIGTVDISYSWAQKALEEFERLQRLYPRNPYMESTEVKINKCKTILAGYEIYVGNFYYKKGSYEAAIQRFSGMLRNYPDSIKAAEALYYIGLSYIQLGQRDRAVDALNDLIEKYPTFNLASHAKEIITSYNNMPHLVIQK